MNKKNTCIIVFLVIASAIAFGRIVSNDFISYDDYRLITENSHVQDGINASSIKWALTDSHLEYWHPLTWLSIMVDWRLFGPNASGHHLVSLLLHIGAVLFLFLFLNKATKSFWPSVFAAAFFALHPLRVESVAWAAERKDVLSMFFGMATLYSYARYAENPCLSRYIVCIILFAFGIMSKPMLLTLPCVLLLLDYWPLARWQKRPDPSSMTATADENTDEEKVKQMQAISPLKKMATVSVKNRFIFIDHLWREKIPFFLFSMLISVFVVRQLHANSYMASLQEFTFSQRIGNALISYVAYLGKTFWPVDLAVFYPYEHSLEIWQVLGAASFLLVISTLVVYFFKRKPFVAVGWFWYLGTLFPVIGFMQAGYQAMADRYTYLPSIGIAIMLAWGVPSLIKRDNLRKNLLFPVSIAVLVIMAVLTWKQCHYWKNSMTLSTHALHVTEDNYVAHNILASYLSQEKRINEAMYHYKESLRLNPKYHYTYNNRGSLYRDLGQYQRAIEDFNAAIGLKQNFATAYINRGETYFLLGQYQLAMEDFNMVIRLKPYDAVAYNNRGGVYFHLGRYPLAIENYNMALSLSPNYASAYSNRASAYLVQGNKKTGCHDAQKACTLGNCKTLELAKSRGDCH